MIAAIVSGVLALGIAMLADSAAPAKTYWFLGTAWLFWAFLALGIESKRDQSRWARLGDWLPLPYDWVMDRVLPGLPHLLLPQSVAQRPRPGSGVWRKLDWYFTPLARDPDDQVRLAGNPWSWPVFDVALRIAILYPLLFALFQWTVTGNSTGLGGLELFPEGLHWLLRTTALCIVGALRSVLGGLGLL